MTSAEQIWHNANIRSLDSNLPIASAIAVRKGRIVAVGSDPDVLNLTGPETTIHDLGGRQVLPGLVESHTHALWGAYQNLFEINISYQATFNQLVEAIKLQVNKTTGRQILTGGPWRPDMRGQMGANPREILDAISREVPIAISDVTKHLLWCNSRALELAGIDAQVANNFGEAIERDANTGKPNGILAEAACAPVRKLLVRTPDQLAQSARYFVAYFNRLGITAFKEPMAMEEDLAAYKAADEKGDLTLHMAAHLVRQSPLVQDMVTYEDMERWRREYASTNIRTSFAKLFLDGVAPSFTASFLQPYRSEAGYDAAKHNPNATLLLEPEEMADTVCELDRRGFTVKMHSVGDNATRNGLNAIEAARQRNGNSGLRHEIAHCAFIDPADLPRFAELDAVAEVSPKLWFPNPATAAQIAVLGEERVSRCHAIGNYLGAGAQVTYASDWPAAAPDANPWTGLAGMISRRDPLGRFPGALGADQAIDLDQALPLFTINGARSLRMENETGSLSPGKWADFIVLDQVLETLSPEEIGAVEVRRTVWKGRTVFER